MSTPVVAVGGILGVAALAGGAYLVYDFSNRETLVTLAQFMEGKTNTGYENKFGAKYKNYLLSPEETDNNSTWEVRLSNFKKREDKQKPTGSFFTSVTDNTAVDAFKKICKDKFKEPEHTSDTDDDKWLEIWNYCGLGEKGLLTLDKSTNKKEKENVKDGDGTWNGKLGGENKTKLISVDSPENNWFWDIRDKEFKDGVLAVAENGEAFFKAEKTKGTKLRDICKLAYSKSTNEGTGPKPTKAEVIKFCSLSKTT